MLRSYSNIKLVQYLAAVPVINDIFIREENSRLKKEKKKKFSYLPTLFFFQWSPDTQGFFSGLISYHSLHTFRVQMHSGNADTLWQLVLSEY